MNSPSPLVPQGAIPPKTTSRPQRVLMIAAMVVGLHVAGLSLVLFQGCGKDGAGTQTASNTDTNTTSGLSYPAADTNASAMFASASNTPAATLGATPTNVYTPTPAAPAGAFAGTPNPGLPTTLPPDQGTPVTPTDTQPVLTGNEKDYKIVKGDNLTTIASRNGVTLSAIMKVNPNLDPKRLKVGQTIKIPQPVAAAPTANVAAAGTGSTPPTTRTATTGGGAAAGTYKVKAGDTLTKIARTHGITVNELRAANNMKTTQVQVGKVLKIPARRTAAAPTNSTTH